MCASRRPPPVPGDSELLTNRDTVLHLNNGGTAVYDSGSASLVCIYTSAINQSVALPARSRGASLDRAGNALAPSAFDSLAPGAAPPVGTHFVIPVDDSTQALMDAFNAGFMGHAANVQYEALIVTFHNGET